MIRSMLFIPGSTQKLLDKGPTSGADALIYDLEDAVSPDQKNIARTMVRDALLATLENESSSDSKRIVRINSIETEYWEEDLAEVLKGKPDMIMLPKVSVPEDVAILIKKLEDIKEGIAIDIEDIDKIEIIPLIETALGIENAYLIASSSPRVTGMLLGGEDLTADLRCKRTKEGNEIFYARSRMVACGRAADVEIYDTPFTDTKDEEGVRNDTLNIESEGNITRERNLLVMKIKNKAKEVYKF